MNAQVPWADHTVIYGGSFDPPHMGHQMACLTLLEGLGCQQIWLMPAFVHAFGKKLRPFAHRFAMCQLLAAPFGARVHVSFAERDMQAKGRTYNLVQSLQAEHPERCFALAIGADVVRETHRWHRWAELAAQVRVVVIGRSGYEGADAHTPDLPAISSSHLRQQLAWRHDVSGQLPASVLRYIHKHKLYVEASCP